ncbi:unnamed protein product [Tenebrio molitor]|nr:unnamed protein product [Tenebrio molitor]
MTVPWFPKMSLRYRRSSSRSVTTPDGSAKSKRSPTGGECTKPATTKSRLTRRKYKPAGATP